MPAQAGLKLWIFVFTRFLPCTFKDDFESTFGMYEDRQYIVDKALAACFLSCLMIFIVIVYSHLPPLLLTVLGGFFLPLAPLNLLFMYHCLLPTLFLCVSLSFSSSEPSALPSAGSRDSCGDCVHNRTLIRFIKVKAAE